MPHDKSQERHIICEVRSKPRDRTEVNLDFARNCRWWSV